MNQELAYNIDLDLAGLLILLMVYAVARLRYADTKDLQSFRRFCLFAIVTVVSDIFVCYSITYVLYLPIAFCKISYIVYYVGQNSMVYFLCSYILEMVERRSGGHRQSKLMWPVKTIWNLSFLAMVLNIFLKFFNDFNHEEGYVHGPLFVVMFMTPVVMAFWSMILFYIGRKYIKMQEGITLIIFYILVSIGVIVRETILPNYMMDGFFIATGALALLLALETPDYKKLMATMAKLEAATKAKDEFLASVSHEIRTPINTMLGMNEIILRKTDDEEVKECSNNAITAGTSLLAIINDILDLSKIEANKTEIVNADYDLSSLISDCYSMIVEKAEDKGLALYFECDENMPSVINGDVVRIRQVIINMLTNAVKYTNHGMVTLKVSMEDFLPDSDQFTMVIKVNDTGIGIKAEDIPKVFDKFSRLELEKNRSVEGTGLGMNLSKSLCNAMGGDISVESQYGKGSTFTVVLPQVAVNKRPVGKIAYKTSKDVSKDIRYHLFEAPSARILAVDDTAMNLLLIKKFLEPSKVIVETASSGKDALNLMCTKEYDIIFMDHLMPEMDGVETYSRFKAIGTDVNEKTPIIMLTANAMAGMKEEYLAMGFNDYLSKPVRGEKLEQMLMKWLPDEKMVVKE
ncbi:MAG: response regulator [Pseudobutyrivibrio sp.]|nr:response regulator [Pseudobutyrivibrio sp.]